MSEYSVEISGKYYKVDSQAILNEINNASTTSEKQEIISSYVASNKATQIDEDEYQELNIGENEPAAGTEEEEYPAGFDYDSYQAYASSTGLSKLTEDSTLDDLIAVFEKIEDEVNELDKKMASIDEDDPDEMASLMSEITNMAVAIGELGKAAGVEFEKNSVVGKTVVSGVAGAVAVGVPAYCIATSAAAISVAVAEGAGVVAATSAAVPGPGWFVAVIAGAVAIGAGVMAYNASKENEEIEKKLSELKENIANTAEKLNGSWDKVTEKFQESGKAVVDEVTGDLEGLLEDEFNFEDVTDVSNIGENIDKIIEAQGKLEPFYNVAKTYGIEIEGLDELMEKLGTGDDKLAYAQEYLDAYAQQVSLNITDEIITDTTTLNGLYENITGLIDETKGKGLDTSKLESLLEKIQTTNQEEADKEADEILQDYGTASGLGTGASSTGGASNVAGALQDMITGSNQAADTAVQVGENSTQYTTDTSQIEQTSETLKSEAQKQLENYAKSITLSGLSVIELEALYKEVSANYEELKQIEGLDCSLLQSKLNEIRQTQQALVDEEIKAFESRANSATTSSERTQIISEINAMISSYSSIQVDVSAAQTLIQKIKEREELDIKTKVHTYLIESGKASSIGEVMEVLDKIQVDIESSQSLGVDVSVYQEALTAINQKIDEIQKQNTSQTTGTTTNNNTYENNSSSNVNMYQNNSTNVGSIDNSTDSSTHIGSIDNSTTTTTTNTDNSTTTNTTNTDNSTTTNTTNTDNSTTITNNDYSTNITNNDNSTTVNVTNDTSKLEEILKDILDKINKENDTPPEVTAPCEDEDEVPVEDDPNINPPITDDSQTDVVQDIVQDIVADETPDAAITEDTNETVENNEDFVSQPEIVQNTAAETPQEEVEDEVVEDYTANETTPAAPTEEQEDTPCEDEDIVNVENQDIVETGTETTDGPRTTAQINAGVEAQAPTEEPEERRQEVVITYEEPNNATIIEGEGGIDYELDFEEDDK